MIRYMKIRMPENLPPYPKTQVCGPVHDNVSVENEKVFFSILDDILNDIFGNRKTILFENGSSGKW